MNNSVTDSLEQRVCVERRNDNSLRLHFNRVGDWRPRLIVWPDYNGLPKDDYEDAFGEPVDDSTDEAWGRIIAETLDEFSTENGYSVIAYESVLPSLWQRLRSPYAATVWNRTDKFELDAAYVNSRQHMGHESPVFLITPIESAASAPEQICDSMLDRANLLPFGVAILVLGIEEAVLEISFAGDEHEFVRTLARLAGDSSHSLHQCDKHFVSHWVVANKEAFGPDWDTF